MAREQYMTALERANKIRLARAQIKRDLNAGKVSIDDLILDPPEAIVNAEMYEILMSMRQWGRRRVLNLIKKKHLNISETTEIGALTDRQKKLLIEEIGKSKKPMT